MFGYLKNEGGNVITLFGSFLRNEGEGFRGVLTTFNPSFLIPQIGDIWNESRVDKLLIK